MANASGTITTYTVDAAGNRTAQISPTIAGNDLLNMGANKIAGLVDHGAAPFGMVPSIPTSNWSKGAFVSRDPARPVEKAVTGTAIAVATTFGGGAAEDAARMSDVAGNAAKGLLGKVSAIAEKVGGWIKGLFGKTEDAGAAKSEGGRISEATDQEHAIDQLLKGEGRDVKPNPLHGKAGAGRQAEVLPVNWAQNRLC